MDRRSVSLVSHVRRAVGRPGWLTLVLMTPGCHQTISLGDDLRSSGGSTEVNASTTEPSTSTPATSESEGADGSSGETGEATDSLSGAGGGSSDSTTESTSGTTGGGACEPEPRDNECLNCAKGFCCFETQSCSSDPDCACLLDCVRENAEPSTCMARCEPNTQSSELATCLAMSCPGVCS